MEPPTIKAPRPDAAVIEFDWPRDGYEAEVRRLCALARATFLVPLFLRLNAPLYLVQEHCLSIALGQDLPIIRLRIMHGRMYGPAGSRRRALPKTPHTYRKGT